MGGTHRKGGERQRDRQTDRDTLVKGWKGRQTEKHWRKGGETETDREIDTLVKGWKGRQTEKHWRKGGETETDREIDTH